MSTEKKGSRRLSIAFDNFRHKCRKTRVDSLLSPPLDLTDLTASCSSDDSSPTGWGGVSLNCGAEYSTAHASHVEYAFPSETEHSINSEADNEVTENQRVVDALGDFQANRAESYDVDTDVGCFFQCKKIGSPEVLYGISPYENEGIEVLYGISPSDLSPPSEDEERGVGAPLVRQGSRGYPMQIQTEPQTKEQALLQTSSLDKRRTVDGVRLDGRSPIKHSGTAAPPQTQMVGSPPMERKYRVSVEEHLHIPQRCWGMGFQHYTPRVKETGFLPIGNQTGISSQRKPSHYQSNSTQPKQDINDYSSHEMACDIYRVDSATQSSSIPAMRIHTTAYPRTPPPAFLPQAQTQTTAIALSSVHNVSSFHHDLCGRLRRSIEGGQVRASQIPVKQRMRRMSEGFGGVGRGVRRMSKGVGDAAAWAGEGIMASGAVGVGWGRMSEGADGRRGYSAAAAVGYGAGFV